MRTVKYNPSGWNSDRQLAELYCVTRCTIWRWAKAGWLDQPTKHSPRVTRWFGNGKVKGGVAFETRAISSGGERAS